VWGGYRGGARAPGRDRLVACAAGHYASRRALRAQGSVPRAPWPRAASRAASGEQAARQGTTAARGRAAQGRHGRAGAAPHAPGRASAGRRGRARHARAGQGGEEERDGGLTTGEGRARTDDVEGQGQLRAARASWRRERKKRASRG
jgi:hypothetical protein